ncbi:MAG: PLP-dependent aminotransferase family protein [Polyangiaceae bacterium]
MTRWDWSLSLDPTLPVFLAIARAVVDGVQSGRLAPGDALPGSRSLAQTLGVHRNTVIAAVRELEAEGWIETSVGKGTFITKKLPETKLSARPHLTRDKVGFELRGAMPTPLGVAHANEVLEGLEATERRHVLALVGGLPDLRLLPLDALARAYRRALSTAGVTRLGYGDPRGEPALRAALAQMIASRRAISVDSNSLVVTRGSQMALHLVSRAILSQGDVVVVERFGYRPAWEAILSAGAKLHAVDVDHDGMDLDALEKIVSKEVIRAVYVTPHHQYPTTAVLSPGRRLMLLELARKHRFAVIEDDYDHEFHYEGRPILPLASGDKYGVVVHIGTLSKILAPGVRIGFVVAPEPVLKQVAILRTFVDRQGDRVVERALAELIEDGELQRHARRMRKVYLERRDVLVESLGKYLPGRLRFDVPKGGLAVWAQAAEHDDVDAWQQRAFRAGVLLQTGRRFAFDGRSQPFFRIVCTTRCRGNPRSGEAEWRKTALPHEQATESSKREAVFTCARAAFPVGVPSTSTIHHAGTSRANTTPILSHENIKACFA